MKLSWPVFARLLLFAAAVALTGCWSGQNAADEEKEPHFLAGKGRVNAMDYQGAIESFQKALEVNPRSGAAHFELGMLLEQRESDPAAAIYHYQQYLKQRPKAGNALVIQQRILACKQELARTVSLGPVTEKQQRDIEKMAEENKRLTEENKRLTEEVNKWRAYYNVAAAKTNQAVTGIASVPQPAAAYSSSNVDFVRTASTAANPAKTHVVKTGETFASIARQYKVKLEALTAANAGIEPRHLKVGQTINLP